MQLIAIFLRFINIYYKYTIKYYGISPVAQRDLPGKSEMPSFLVRLRQMPATRVLCKDAGQKEGRPTNSSAVLLCTQEELASGLTEGGYHTSWVLCLEDGATGNGYVDSGFADYRGIGGSYASVDFYQSAGAPADYLRL